MNPIQLVDLKKNYNYIKGEIDEANLQLQNFQCVEGLDDEKNEFLSNFIFNFSITFQISSIGFSSIGFMNIFLYFYFMEGE